MVRVFVSGDGDTDLDVYVYDEDGNLVASDDECCEGGIAWTPCRIGKFTIKVINRGSVYNCYTIRIVTQKN